jgi:hypothetical protein
MIGISAATDGAFGAARVEMLSSSSGCLYIAGAIRIAAGPESFGMLVLRSAVTAGHATRGNVLFIRTVQESD